MRIKPAGHRGAIIAMAVLLGGCFFRHDASDCRSVQEYQQSVGVQPVAVPSGLSVLDKSARLAIPSAPAPAKPLAEAAACLAKPPDYFRKAASADAKETGPSAGVPTSSPPTKTPPETPPPPAGR
jgi:hypothetical protein